MSVIDEPTGELPIGSWVPWSEAADDPVTAEVAVPVNPRRPPMGPEPAAPAESPDPAEVVAGEGVAPEGFPRRGPFRALLVAAGSVIVVAVGITAMNVASRHSDAGGPSPTVVPAVGSQASPGPELRSHSVLPPVLPPITASTPQNQASANAGTSAAPSALAPPAVAAGPVPPVSVTVLNSTSIQGLGSTEQQRLAADGWQVRRVTSVNLRVDETTVYYDAAQADAARTLLARVPSVKVMKPRPMLLARTGGLIVVVAADAR